MSLPVLQISNVQAWGLMIGIFGVAISVVVLLVQLRYSFKGLKESIDRIGDDVSDLSGSVSRIQGYLMGMDQPPETTDGGQFELSEFVSEEVTTFDALNENNLSRQYVYRYSEGVFASNPVDIAVERPIGENKSEVVKINFESEHEKILQGISEIMGSEDEYLDSLIQKYGFEYERVSMVPRVEVSIVLSDVEDIQNPILFGIEVLDYFDAKVKDGSENFYKELFDN